MSQGAVIQKILSKILNEIQERSNCLCVFDLDSTLICVRERTQRILQKKALCPQFVQNYPDQAKVLENIKIHPKDFSLIQMFNRENLKLPYDLYKEFFLYWTDRFFSNEYLIYDTLYAGVQYYLSSLEKAGTEIMYLTGRSRGLMGEGTLSQIKKWNLPLKKEEYLMMKPNAYTEDAYFKKCRLEELSKKYGKIWFFENEPVVINFVNKFLNEIQIIFVNTVHSQRQTLKKDFYTITADYSI